MRNVIDIDNDKRRKAGYEREKNLFLLSEEEGAPVGLVEDLEDEGSQIILFVNHTAVHGRHGQVLREGGDVPGTGEDLKYHTSCIQKDDIKDINFFPSRGLNLDIKFCSS